MFEEQLLILTSKQKLLQPQIPKLSVSCDACRSVGSKYTCPKCNGHLCSLPCYRSHNEQCVKSLDERNRRERLKGIKASFDEQIAMKKQLGRLYREMKEETIIPMNQENEITRLEELLEKIEANELQLSDLSHREQVQFREYMNSLKLDEAWTPWWEVHEGVFSLFVDEEETDADSKSQSSTFTEPHQFSEFRSKMKDKIAAVISFDKLCRKPSPDLVNHLANLVFGIATTARQFNGDFCNISEDFCQQLLANCYSLREKRATQIGDLRMAFEKVREDLTKTELNFSDRFPIIEDACKIFSNKFFVVELLLQVYEQFHQWEEESLDHLTTVKEVHLRKQKLLFFLSYVLKQNHSFFKTIRNSLIDLYRS